MAESRQSEQPALALAAHAPITISDNDPSRLPNLQMYLSGIPHAKAIGLQVRAVGDQVIEVVLPYADFLVGDPDTGVLHGGAITALLDNAAGFVTRPLGSEPGVLAIATLDLRIDYMGPATPGLDVVARARCYRRTASVAFVRAEAFHYSPDDPIATCAGAFMIGTPNGPQPVGGGR